MHIVMDLQGGMIAFFPRMKKLSLWDWGSFYGMLCAFAKEPAAREWEALLTSVMGCFFFQSLMFIIFLHHHLKIPLLMILNLAILSLLKARENDA